MSVDRVLAALEEYFDLKRDLVSSDLSELRAAKERAAKTLNSYIQSQFDHFMLEERRRNSSATKKVVIPDVSRVKFTWDDIVHLLDALNSCPMPPKHDGVLDKKWVEVYREWYQQKRPKAMRSISPAHQDLELDFEDETLKKR